MSLLLTDLMEMGASGVICPIGAIAPKLSISSVQQFKLLRFVTGFPVNLLKHASSPQAPSKEALRLLGIDITATVRRPLPALEAHMSNTILEHLKKAQLVAEG